MHKYEIMFIVRANMEEDAIKKVADKFSNILTDNKAKVLNTKDWGQRELAYEIDKHKKGYYYILEVEADNNAISEFDRLARINEDIIRYMIVKND